MRIIRLAVTVVMVMVLIAVGAVSPAVQPVKAQPGPTFRGLPDADENSGRFINVTRGMESLGDVPDVGQVLNVSLEISQELTEFRVWIFDGDMGGMWDRWGSKEPLPPGGASGPYDDVNFVLFRDPNVAGNTASVDQLAFWPGVSMLDDTWFQAVVDQDPLAWNPGRGAYYYHLVCFWDGTKYANEQNNFKIAVNGRPFLRAGSTVGFEGQNFKINDPICEANPASLGCMHTSYDGTFTFYFTLPEDGSQSVLGYIDLYDGDADLRGDTDDTNSDPMPPFATSTSTKNEGVNPGKPADDNLSPPLVIPPAVYYELTGPNSVWTKTNANPSGNSEWELFRIAKTGAVLPKPPDYWVDSLPSGTYTWRFRGLDAKNTMFLHVDYELDMDRPEKASLGNTVWSDTDLDGYWDYASELGIGGVKINLYWDVDGDKKLDAGDQYLRSEATGLNGQYNFTGLDGNKNYLVEVTPENFAVGGALNGYLQTIDRSTVADDHYNRFTPWGVYVPSNTYYRKADFGFWKTAWTNPGAGTPGYWKNHPNAWPVDGLWIGGQYYTKAECIAWMKRDDSQDKRVTMFRSLVCAKLNVLFGNNPTCISEAIFRGDAWMATYGGAPVPAGGTNSPWRTGEPLYLQMDAYNNGLLCAPHRD